jgi:transcription antitermination factor NusG
MKAKFDYKAGDTVRIKSGPFALFTGRVVMVNHDEATLKVTIKFQNEWRILKLRFLDVEKAPAL